MSNQSLSGMGLEEKAGNLGFFTTTLENVVN